MTRALLLLVLVSAALIAIASDAGADDIRLLLDRVQVVREREASGDRPYFATIAFRSTLNRRGSTSLRVIENEPHDWVSKPAWHRVHASRHLQQGASAEIPFWMGGIEWRNVNIARFNAADRTTWNAAVTSEVLGAIVVAIDNNNTPPHVFKDLLNQAIPKFRTILVRHVESGRIVRGALGGTAFDTSEVEQQIETMLRELLADNALKLLFQLTVGSTFNPDQIVGVHAFIVPALTGLSEVARPTERTQSGLPGGAIKIKSLRMNPRNQSRTVTFEGSGGIYNVNARLQRDNRAGTEVVRQVRFELFTGSDDMRGDTRALAIVETSRGTVRRSMNPRGGLASRSRHRVNLDMPRGTRRSDIRRIGIEFHAGGGRDQWDLDGLKVTSHSSSAPRLLYVKGGRGMQDFSPRRGRWWEIVGPAATPSTGTTGTGGTAGTALVRRLEVSVRTGNDDLRGGNDNATAYVHIRGRAPVRASINNRRRLADRTTRDITITLAGGVPRADLQAIEIRTTLGGGMGGDNWNLARLRVVAHGDAGRAVLVDRQGRPLHRFTGSSQTVRFSFPRP